MKPDDWLKWATENSTERFLRGMKTYNRNMHSLINDELIIEHGTIDIDWDESPPNDRKEVAMPEDNSYGEWDNWCHLWASKPTRSDWWWAIAALLTLVGIIAVGVKCWMLMR